MKALLEKSGDRAWVSSPILLQKEEDAGEEGMERRWRDEDKDVMGGCEGMMKDL